MNSRAATSLHVFRSHIVRLSDGLLDASGVISPECYNAWLANKCAVSSVDQMLKFFRALTNHTSGSDGRTPFDVAEEAAILVVLRRKEPWPCFPAQLAHMGRRYRSKGYHEKLALKNEGGGAIAVKTITPPPPAVVDAAVAHQRPLPPENMSVLLSGLTQSEVAYVKYLCRNIVRNYSSPTFSLEDWHSVNEVLRFVVLSKTPANLIAMRGEEQRVAAKSLCEAFTHDDTTVSMVFNMAADTYMERALWQNEYSIRIIGPILRNSFARGVDGSELFSTVLAVSSAYLRPGRSNCVYNQQHWCVENETAAFDMNFYVDPASLLLVVWGKLSKAA